MGGIPLLKEGRAARGRRGAHDYVADGSHSIIRLHCDITDVIAAARQRPR
ncbi:hypothetical protein IVB33_12375 [Bradyrhizobium sp. 24]|jgi:hypothetical protein|nr:hypothetical protein [Bradyrhizobium sp. 24]